MKKILAIVMSVAMILTMGVVFATAAELHPTADKTAAGVYVTGADNFEPVGDIAITWVADAADKITFDGKVEEWGDYDSKTLTPDNFISWVGGGTKDDNGVDAAMPAGFQITARLIADKDYLYVSFNVVDPDVVLKNEGGEKNYSSGDCFQMNFDFGGMINDIVENNPEIAEAMPNTKSIFYSFGYVGDGQPIIITRQESGGNDGDLTEESSEGAVKGYTAKTTDGWSAEFALSWQMLYDDAVWKSFNEEEPTVEFGGDNNIPLINKVGMYYLNQSTNEDGSKSGITWAAGTGSGIMKDDTTPAVSFDAYDAGITLKLEAVEGMEFTCENIVVLEKTATDTGSVDTGSADTEPAGTTAGTTADTEPAGTTADTEPAGTTADTEPAATEPAGTTADTKPAATEPDGTTADTKPAATEPDGTTADTEPADEDGCGSVIGATAVVAVMAAAAAAVVLKKKD